MPDFIVGLDLGQSSDPTALAVLRRSLAIADRGMPLRNHRDDMVFNFDCVHMERFTLGTPYPEIVKRVVELLSNQRLQPQPRLAIDATGVGRAVVDLVLNQCIADDAFPISITAGDTVRRDVWGSSHVIGYWVPKRELVGSVQSALQSGRLKVASRLAMAETLKKELLNFQVKITAAANETFGAWRENAHDDLVLAVAMAIWLGERREIDFLPADSACTDRDSLVLASEESADRLAMQKEVEAVEREREKQFRELQRDWGRMNSPHWWD
jgi:hypothetical protein